MNKNLWLLTLCQGLFLTNNVAFIAINGLVGLSLAPWGWMATLPVMAYVLGGALATPLVAWTQTAWGRKRSFQSGALVVAVACVLCVIALLVKSFWLLCTATLVAGYFNANAQLYRFAAADLASSGYKEKAVSWVLAGGLLGAVAGPNLANWARDFAATPYLAIYVLLSVLAVFSVLCLQFIYFPAMVSGIKKVGEQKAKQSRSLGMLVRQPIFLVAAGSAALSYGVMNLLMAATPIAMQMCGMPFSDAALVIEWHVVGMFAPGFFTGSLIKRFGSLPMMLLGVLLNALCIGIALSGQSFMQFGVALFLLGVGWNFLFTGSTTLALQTYSDENPEEKNRAQNAINFAVFATLAVSSFASGLLIDTQGWMILNLGSIVPVLCMTAAIIWLMLEQRRTNRIR